MEHNYPLISIIIPVYNREDFIEQAMDSVLQENYPNKELVIIDDGSTDNTKALIEAWIEKNERLIPITFESRNNKGFIPTLNELIKASNGEYIVFFGSDDYLKNDGILKRYQYLQANTDKWMVVGDCNLINARDEIVHESAYIGVGKVDKGDLKTDAGMRKFMILNGYVPGATLMADKRIYQEFGLYDESLHAEDWVYYIRVVAKNRLGFLDDIVSAYRVHDNNMCFSSMQLVQAKEQFVLALRLFGEFSGMDRFYLTKRIAFSLAYIPYLWLKFTLLDIDKKSSSPQSFSRLVLKALLRTKNSFMHLMGRQFARQTGI